MIAILIGIGIWLFAVFAQYLNYQLSPEWWMNVILYSSLQTIGTAIIVRKLHIGGRK